MGMCEMCGYDGQLHRAIIEGTMLHICTKCLKYGEAIEVKRPVDSLVSQRLQRSSRFPKSFKPNPQKENLIIVKDYYQRVKQARQKLSKTQEDIAKAIAERSSVIQRVEAGSLEPSIKLAKKLQQYLKIQLVVEEEKVASDILDTYGSSEGGFTIEDIIKRKK